MMNWRSTRGDDRGPADGCGRFGLVGWLRTRRLPATVEGGVVGPTGAGRIGWFAGPMMDTSRWPRPRRPRGLHRLGRRFWASFAPRGGTYAESRTGTRRGQNLADHRRQNVSVNGHRQTMASMAEEALGMILAGAAPGRIRQCMRTGCRAAKATGEKLPQFLGSACPERLTPDRKSITNRGAVGTSGRRTPLRVLMAIGPARNQPPVLHQ